ncbi:hypothetical protein BGZ96_007333 [Linnemannia gamsii]|uniref:F-box domain-containing protein n=1 Tax=Linnemannia gamsii TaxID=64522 RepID=A0ABQ7K0J0_9FUNG|nr:hypothetical protein BGZ96_007333 [Linnemannia gamsii]
MPTLSSLPLECLQLVIRQLADQRDTITLAALLRVNRHFCTVTLPILYQNPFDLIAPVSFTSELQPWYVSSVTKLARTLLLILTDYLDTAPDHPDVVLWGSKANIPVKATFRALQRDLTWALCANAERIQSLVIPLSDIDRYRSLVCRFKILSDVGFLQEGQYKHTWLMSGDEKNTLRSQQHMRTELLEKMIFFVQEHKHKHGATLQTARCSGRIEDECIPEEFKQRLSLILHPLSNPRSLDNRNWDQFLAKFEDINLSLVRDVSPSLDYEDDAAMDRLVKKGAFLHRCRTLDSFIMNSPGDDIFQWAVDERTSHDADIAAGRIPHKSLVPLRVFKVTCYHKSFGRQLNDVVFAFNKTLEIISTNCCWEPIHGNNNMEDNFQEELSDFTVGGGGENSVDYWDLPRLTTLHLGVYYHSIFLLPVPDLLTRLSQLTHLKLIDRRHEYKPSDIVTWHSASLPNLVDLTLIGTPAISFNPETLRSTSNLVRMDLRMHDYIIPGIVPFVPPTEELEESFAQPRNETTAMPATLLKRPVWTWDWDLPKLTKLLLNAEFAYRFEFRMLVGTPNLKSFDVSSSSSSRDHKRTLGLSDFLIPGFDHPSLAPSMDEDRQFQESYVASDANDRNTTSVATTTRTEYDDQESDVKEAPETTKALGGLGGIKLGASVNAEGGTFFPDDRF